MNLIDILKGQLLTPDALGKLGSLVGESKENTESALNASLPVILSSILKMGGSSNGLSQLTNILNGVQGLTPDALGKAISSLDPSAIQKGGSLLTSLLGSGSLATILGLIAKVAGLQTGLLSKLLSAVAPMILGVIANQWKQSGGTPAALSSLLDSQKSSIEAALPKGLSLADLPDLSGAASAAANKAQEAGSSIVSKILPIAALALLALAAYSLLGKKGEEKAEQIAETVANPGPAPAIDAKLPEFNTLTGDLTKSLGSLTETLNSIKDVASAEAALPKIKALGDSFAPFKAVAEKITTVEKANFATFISDHVGKLKAIAEKILAIPGVGEKLKPTLDAAMAQLSSLAG